MHALLLAAVIGVSANDFSVAIQDTLIRAHEAPTVKVSALWPKLGGTPANPNSATKFVVSYSVDLIGFDHSGAAEGTQSYEYQAPVSFSVAAIKFEGAPPEGVYVATVNATLFKWTGNHFTEVAAAATSAVVGIVQVPYAAAGLAMPNTPTLISSPVVSTLLPHDDVPRAVGAWIPPGAVAVPTLVRVSEVGNLDDTYEGMGGPVYEYLPSMVFTRPVTIFLPYDPNRNAIHGAMETGNLVANFVDGEWFILSDTSVNPFADIVTANTTHFSIFGVVIQSVLSPFTWVSTVVTLTQAVQAQAEKEFGAIYRYFRNIVGKTNFNARSNCSVTSEYGFKHPMCWGLQDKKTGAITPAYLEPNSNDYYPLDVASFAELFDANSTDGPYKVGLAGVTYDERVERIRILIENALAVLATESPNLMLSDFFQDSRYFTVNSFDGMGPNEVGGLRGWAIKNKEIDKDHTHWGWHTYSVDTGLSLVALIQTALAIKQFIADYPEAGVANQPVFSYLTADQKMALRQSYYFLNPKAARTQSTVRSCREAIAAVNYKIDAVSSADCFSLAKRMELLTYSDFEAIIRAYTTDILDWWTVNASRRVTLSGGDGRFFMYLYPDDQLKGEPGQDWGLASGYVVHNVNIIMGRAAFMAYLLLKDAGRSTKANDYLEIAKATQRMFRLGEVVCRQKDRLSVEGDWAYYVTNCRPYGAHWSELVNYPNNPRWWTKVDWRGDIMEAEDTEHSQSSVALNGLMQGDSLFNTTNYYLGHAAVASEVVINYQQWFNSENCLFYNTIQCTSAYLSPESRLNFYWDSTKRTYILSSNDKSDHDDWKFVDYPLEWLEFKRTPECWLPCKHLYPAFGLPSLPERNKYFGIDPLHAFVEGANADGFEMTYWWYRAFARRAHFSDPECRTAMIQFDPLHVTPVINPYFKYDGKNGYYNFELLDACDDLNYQGQGNQKRKLGAQMMWAAKKRSGTTVTVPDSSPVLSSACGQPSDSCTEVPYGGKLALIGSNFGNSKHKVLINNDLVDAEAWTRTSIGIRLPKTSAFKPSQNYPLIVRVTWDNGTGFHNQLDYVETNAKAVWVRSPKITAAPSVVRRNDVVTLAGNFFGDQGGTVSLGGKPLGVHSWSNTLVQVLVDRDTPLGEQIGILSLGDGVDVFFVTTVVEAPKIIAVTPQHLPSGGSFSIEGDSFGGSPGSVKVSGIEANIISWSDLSISAQLPSIGLPAGDHEVVVMDLLGRKSNYSPEVVPTRLTVHAPAISSIFPLFDIPGGSGLTISGDFFGERAEIGQVMFGDQAATIIYQWTNNVVEVLPPILDFGSHAMRVVVGSLSSNDVIEYYVRPRVDAVAPKAGTGGDVVSLAGVFGANEGLVFFNGSSVDAARVGWASNNVAVEIPVNANPGRSGYVEVNGQAGPFLFDLHPSLLGVSPSSASSGDYISINGTNFGGWIQGGAVYLGSNWHPTWEFGSWSPEIIEVKIPDMTLVGPTSVFVNAGGLESVGQASVVLLPKVRSVEPKSVRVGEVVRVTGTNFGDTPQGRIDGALAEVIPNSFPFFLDIVVPETVAAGERVLWVDAVGYFSNPAPITVIPTADKLSSSSGTVGSPFTIEGTALGLDASVIRLQVGDRLIRVRSVVRGTNGYITSVTGEIPSVDEGTYEARLIVNGISSNSVSLTVFPSDRFTKLAASNGFTCVAKETAANPGASPVLCWGANNYGQLGNGAAGQYSAVPVQVSLPVGRVEGLATASQSACALVNGDVWCWGRNNRGQLGGATTAPFTTAPVRLIGLAQPEQIVAGRNHFCTMGGSVVCWGDNSNGQVNPGAQDQIVEKPFRLEMSAVKMVEAGGDSSCAVFLSGYMTCWSRSAGLLQPPPELQNIVDLTIGSKHLCALGTWPGSAPPAVVVETRCWGENNVGQLGNGTVSEYSATPLSVALGAIPIDVVAGYQHTCVTTPNETAYCWGGNASGQVGSGNFITPVANPNNVWGLAERVEEISAGNSHTCAIIDFGKAVRCWGDSSTGTIGLESVSQSAPVVAASYYALSDVPTITSHTQFGNVLTLIGQNFGATADVITVNGVAMQTLSWGETEVKLQLPSGLSSGINTGVLAAKSGNALFTFTVLPYISSILPAEIHAGDEITILGNQLSSSSVPSVKVGLFTFSANTWSETAIRFTLPPSFVRGAYPLSVITNNVESNELSITVIDNTPLPQVVSGVTGGWKHTCAISLAKTVSCWGLNSSGQLGTGDYVSGPMSREAVGLLQVKQLALSLYSSCALTEFGEVWCWGSNEHGELGSASTFGQSLGVPTKLDLPGIKAITAGFHYFCAIDASDSVICWGANDYHQQGTGALSGWGFRRVEGLPSPVSMLTAGGATTCAVANDEIWCIGLSHQGQAGTLSTYVSSSPTRIQGLNGAIQKVTGGQYHFCAIVGQERKVKCWGDNRYSQQGDLTTTSRPFAADVLGLGEVVDISSHISNAHTCTVAADRSVWCWGYSWSGALGIDPLVSLSSSPVPVQGVSEASSVGVGYLHSCAVHHSGQGIQCWGDNSDGQLGVSSPASTYLPVEAWFKLMPQL